ncbi:hypothetical protein BCR34DRAFT_552259 [Clohesyomyces aquaticus]|uniref:Uncharacterized protein n=1 Tax=Clohesyomyces aquaticus TaxID=1231657 RepID=A0A1Y2AB40_9PLEO|nr:hypothetical protein BCR34DRAFT_552259 [Clohesyomyces aquaticus]
MPQIEELTSNCHTSFVELSRAAKKKNCTSLSPSTIKDYRERFDLWAGNLGARQSGRSSLTFRLRDSIVMQTNVIKLLHKLENTLQSCLVIVKEERIPFEEWPGLEQSITPESSESDSETETSGHELATTELQYHTLTVTDILSDLGKLSFKIRNSAGRTDPFKAFTFQDFDGDTQRDRLAVYEDYDRRHVREHIEEARKSNSLGRSMHSYESTPDDEHLLQTLVDRFSASISRRRRMLQYRQRHAEKLALVTELKKDQTPQKEDKTSQKEITGGEAPTVSAMNLNKQATKTIQSGTEGTRYDPKLDEVFDAGSDVSYASTAFDVNGTKNIRPCPSSRGIGGHGIHVSIL